MEKVIPVVHIVYQPKSGGWRGFCYPYDVSCIGTSERQVVTKLENLVHAYEDSLVRHGNPSHLIDKDELTDQEDTEMLKRAWPEISKKMAQVAECATTPRNYADCLSSRVSLTRSGVGSASFTHRGVGRSMSLA